MFKFSTKRFVLVVETRIYCLGRPRTLLANFPASVSFERFESVTRSFWNIEGSSAVQYLGGGLSKPGSEAASTAAYCQTTHRFNPPKQTSSHLAAYCQNSLDQSTQAYVVAFSKCFLFSSLRKSLLRKYGSDPIPWRRRCIEWRIDLPPFAFPLAFRLSCSPPKVLSCSYQTPGPDRQLNLYWNVDVSLYHVWGVLRLWAS